jgi:DNA-binding CsgD family transcriptional regulator
MGRMIDSAVVILQFISGCSRMSAVAVLVMDIVVLAAVIVAMAVSGGFNLSPASDSEHALEETGSTQGMPESVPPPADPLDIIGESCYLTPTERRVLRELVRTDDKQDVIAASLNMSVNTLRHHITSIYKKTGVQTRAALCKLTVTGDR